MRSHLYSLAHAILKAHVWYVTRLKDYLVCFPIYLLLLPSLNALFAYIELFIYFCSFVKLLSVFHETHLNTAKTIVSNNLYKCFFCSYMWCVAWFGSNCKLYKWYQIVQPITYVRRDAADFTTFKSILWRQFLLNVIFSSQIDLALHDRSKTVALRLLGEYLLSNSQATLETPDFGTVVFLWILQKFKKKGNTFRLQTQNS